MTSIPLSLLDELYLNLDRDLEPWTVHYEVTLREHLDRERLTDAIALAARRHPLARARLASWRFQDRGYDWDIADELDRVPLQVVSCVDEAALAAQRERLFSVSPSLATAPPFAVVLAHCTGGDSLLLNLHHAAGDGISAARLMLSILRAYLDMDDPTPPVDPLRVRDVRVLSDARTAQERHARLAELAVDAWRPLAPPARVARDGGNNRPAYGFELFSLSPEESRTLFAAHPHCTTVNDVLLAALAVAIGRWNAEHGRRTRAIALSVPVNLRPPEWRREVFSNFASWVTVWVRPRPDEDLNAVAKRVAARTRAIKRDRIGGMSVDLIKVPGRLTIAAKRWLHYVKAMSGDSGVDTALLSNLGRIDPLPGQFDHAQVWFSPPSQMPLGASIGVVTGGERLHVTLRYRHAQFDPDAAHRFVELYRSVLFAPQSSAA
jgi:NRPS condensation-like uncharacterized protein